MMAPALIGFILGGEAPPNVGDPLLPICLVIMLANAEEPGIRQKIY